METYEPEMQELFLVNIEAQQSVIGAVLEKNAVFDDCDLTPQDFYGEQHQKWWEAICHLIGKGTAADPVTIAEHCDGGPAMSFQLFDLKRNTASAANAKHYARIVRELSGKRHLAELGKSVMALAHTPMAYPDMLNEMQGLISAHVDRAADEPLQADEDSYARMMQRLEDRAAGKNPPLKTPFADLNAKIGGLEKTDLVIVAGRPAMGKTVFGLNCAESVLRQDSGKVLVFSMEMDDVQLMMRMAASIGTVDAGHLKSAELDEKDYEGLTYAGKFLTRGRLFVDPAGQQSLFNLQRRARAFARKHPDLALIVVDYVQMMYFEGGEANRANEIAAVSRGLKALAKELQVPILILAQLNRGVENRTNKRPVMSDLKESGGLEQDADLIIGLYRDVVYNEDTEDPTLAEAILLKQRAGEIGTVRLTFQGQYNRFVNHVPEFRDRYAGAAERKGKY